MAKFNNSQQGNSGLLDTGASEAQDIAISGNRQVVGGTPEEAVAGTHEPIHADSIWDLPKKLVERK